jgi:hypothetical protein
MDPIDPVKYDFALFGLGIFDGFWEVIFIHFNKKNLLTKTVYLRTISDKLK